MTPRDRARQQTLVDIRRIAWRHLEEQGAAALSLRAVARELGVVSSAIYRYVPSRDDLLTDLIVEGYDDLAEAASSALANPALAGSRGRERWLAVAEAVRSWALARPAAWSLLYGSPVPGYQAPAERTTESGTRVIALLAEVVFEAVASGEWVAPSPAPTELADGLIAAAHEIGAPSPVVPEAVAGTSLGWTMLVGAVTSEVFEQLGVEPFGSASAWTRYALGASADLAGLRA